MSLIGEENAYKPNLKENSIEEVKLKNRRKANREGAERMADLMKRKKMEYKRRRKEDAFLTPEKLLSNNRKRMNDRKRFRRQDKRLNNAFIHVDSTDGLLIVLRIRNTADSYKATNKILKEFNLTEDLSAVFIRKTPEVMRKLVLVEPYVSWGKPSMTLIKELLSKHAFTMVDGKRTAISDNIMVEDKLGDKDIICIADMEKEIATLGPAFDDVKSFLAPFIFTSNLSQMEVAVLHKNKIDSGDQGDKINDIIRKIL